MRSHPAGVHNVGERIYINIIRRKRQREYRCAYYLSKHAALPPCDSSSRFHANMYLRLVATSGDGGRATTAARANFSTMLIDFARGTIYLSHRVICRFNRNACLGNNNAYPFPLLAYKSAFSPLPAFLALPHQPPTVRDIPRRASREYPREIIYILSRLASSSTKLPSSGLASLHKKTATSRVNYRHVVRRGARYGGRACGSQT